MNHHESDRTTVAKALLAVAVIGCVVVAVIGLMAALFLVADHPIAAMIGLLSSAVALGFLAHALLR